MESSRLKRIFGSTLTALGIIMILFTCVLFLSDNPVLGFTVTKWETLVPFTVGLVFLISGINLISSS